MQTEDKPAEAHERVTTEIVGSNQPPERERGRMKASTKAQAGGQGGQGPIQLMHAVDYKMNKTTRIRKRYRQAGRIEEC